MSLEAYIQQTIDTVWETVATSPHTAQLHSSLNDLFSKLTQGGTLPSLPEWKDLPGGNWVPTPPPPPPPPRGIVSRFGDGIARHPYLFAFVTTGSVAGGAYYLFPNAIKQALAPVIRPLKPFLPLQLLLKTDRPLRVTGSHGEVRKEAVLVLGAEGLGREVALDLESRGWIVFATVKDPAQVDVLERKSRGWMKVLVLDPNESSSVAPFLRSLTTALSLRFPLHTSGDPFSRPSHSLALVSLVNCLSLHSHTELRPIEGIETEEIRRSVGERVATVVGVLRGVMPILRTMAGRPAAPEGVILSLMPATTAKVDLPFLSLASAADAAILTILNCLRRELIVSHSSNLSVTILELGFFDLPPSASSPSTEESNPTAGRQDTLSPRLASIYAPALRRSEYLGRAEGRGRKGSAPKKLCKRIFEILVYGRGGTTTRVGAGVTTYHLISLLPHLLVDLYLSFQDRLITLLLSHRPVAPPPTIERPLPHPPFLQPGVEQPSSKAQVDPFTETPAEEQDCMSEGSEEGKSSIEDFGVPSGMSSLGSFVGSEAGWRDL